ncbi:MAG: T9SS type A sorting domain-containing protein [Dysgonamonadaceae bacterium]|jgi:hypothetical protein|nr:T9SS type A sorting domain-containing protein [Dysgonamonadaceae bacterium]
MRKKLFFLMMLGIVFGYASVWAQQDVTTQLLKIKSVKIPDKIYDGKKDVPVPVQADLDKWEIVFTDATDVEILKTDPLYPKFKVTNITPLSDAGVSALVNTVNVTFELTDHSQGWVFRPGTAQADKIYEITEPAIISVQPAPLTIKSIDTLKKIYDAKTTGKPDDLKIGFGGLVAGENLTYSTDYTISSVEFEDPNVGSDKKVEVKGIALIPNTTKTRNYYLVKDGAEVLSIDTVFEKGVIEPAVIFIASVTLEKNVINYGEGAIAVKEVTFNPVLTPAPVLGTDYTILGWMDNGNLNPDMPENAGVYGENEDNKRFTIKVKWDNSKNPNYQLVDANNIGTGSINNLVAINPKAYRLVYKAQSDVVYNGDKSSEIMDKGAYDVDPADYTNLSDIVTGELSVDKDSKNVGTYTVTKGDVVAASPNYQITDATDVVKFSIKPLPITIAPTDTILTYGETLVFSGLKVTTTPDLIDGDKLESVKIVVDNGKIKDGDKPSEGSYVIKIDGGYKIEDGNNGGNYAPSAVDEATLTVNKVEYVVKPDAGFHKIYGDVDPKITYKVYDKDGKVVTETIVEGELDYDGVDVGDHVLHGNNLTLKDGKNHTLSVNPDSVTFEIRKAVVYVETHDASKAVSKKDDELDPEFGSAPKYYSFSVFNGDKIEDIVSAKLTREPGEVVGNSYKYIPFDISEFNGSRASNYSFIWKNEGKFTITDGELFIKPAYANKAYGDPDPDPLSTYEVFTDATASTTAETAVIAKITGKLDRVKDADDKVGKYNYVVDGLKCDGYSISLCDKVEQFEIVKAVAEVQLDSLSKIYGDADPDFVATAIIKPTAAKTAIIIEGIKREAGNDVKDSYEVTAETVKGGDNYSVVFKPGKLNILPRELTVIANDASKVYGTEDPDVLDYTVEGLQYNADKKDIIAGKLTRITGDSVGIYDIINPALVLSADSLKLTTLGEKNYILKEYKPGKFEVTKAQLTITPKAASKVYGEKDPAFKLEDAEFKSLIASDEAKKDEIIAEIAKNGKIIRVAGEDVNSYAYEASNLTHKNYDITIGTTTKFTITAKEIKIVPSAKTKKYGEADPEFAWEIDPTTPLVNPDTKSSIIGELERVAGEDVKAYDYKIGSLKLNDNYKLTISGTNKFTIEKGVLTADMFDVKDTTFIYDGNPYSAIVTPKAGLSISIKSLKYGVTKREAPVNAGHYSIYLTADADTKGNYTVDGDILLKDSLKIRERHLFVYALNQSKVVGGIDPTFTYGYVDWDEATVPCTKGIPFTGKLTREEGEDLGGEYKIYNDTDKPEFLTAGSDYLFIIPEGDDFVESDFIGGVKTAILTINADPTIVPEKEKVTVTVKEVTIVYGDALPSTYDYTVDPAGVEITGSLDVTKIKNVVGTYPIEKGDLDVVDKDKYVINFVGASLVITPASLTVTAKDAEKTYGENDPEFAYEVTGLKYNDKAEDVLDGELTRAAGEKAGVYDIKKGTLSLVSNNYDLTTFTGAKFTIGKAGVVIDFPEFPSDIRRSGAAFPIGATTEPAGLKLTYTSSDDKIATVSAAGIITPKYAGKTTITVEFAGNDNYNSAKEERELTILDNVGIATVEAGEIAIYPSVAPRNSVIRLDANVDVTNAKVAVYNINGKLISETAVQDKVSELITPADAGVYLYVFKGEGFSRTLRVIVK